MKRCLQMIGVAVAEFGLTMPAFADVKLHGLFTDNMVLQRDMPIAIFGTGDDGEAVTVEFNGQTAKCKVAGGQWKATLPPMKAGGPFTLAVAGKNSIAIKNILVGDVWLCTGQSNMAGTLASYKSDAYKEYQQLFAGMPEPNDRIRMFKLKQSAADTPQRDVVTSDDFGPQWRPCDDKSAMLFSAVGYLFGSKLQKQIGVPVGLIYATLGGTKAESWVSLDTLKSRPEFQVIFDDYEAAKKSYPAAMKQYEKAMAEWKAKKPAEREGKRGPQPPMGPNHVKRPTGLYNFEIAPMQQFPIKGAIWYQGESNAGRAVQYRTLFPALITSWRRQWGQGDFPFLFVQLAAFHKLNPEPEDPDWAWLREAQAMTLSLPNTGMAVAIDAGHQTNIHPPYKPLVADRLVACALKIAYGRDVVGSGPTFRRMTVNGNQAVIEFDHVGSGLVTKDVDVDGGNHVPASRLTGFAVCGEDKKFKWADAVIRNNTVVVSCPDVAKPVAVRYAWSDFPLCNLYNKEGFPAVPFRTDQFEQKDAGRTTGIAVGKPFTCNQPITNGLFGGLTDGELKDSSKTSFATNGAVKFPKEVTVDLQGRFTVSEVRVYNSALGGTKTVEVQVSGDGREFKTLGKTEFKNYSPDTFELTKLNAKGVGFVRLVFPDVHEISFQHKPNGFVFLRELEVQGTPEK